MIRAQEGWLVVEAVDMRGGIDGLSQRIQNLLGRSPCDGTAYGFRNRRGTRLKLIVWDGTGNNIIKGGFPLLPGLFIFQVG